MHNIEAKNARCRRLWPSRNAASGGWVLSLGLALLCACSGGGNSSDDGGVDQSSAVDKTAPRFSGLNMAVASGTTTIDLSWSAATDDRTSPGQITYLIYMASASLRQTFSTPSFMGTAGSTMYQVTGLDLATKYYFVVRARDEAGNVDTNLTERNATTLQRPDTMAPTFAGVATTAVTGNSVALGWTEATDDLALPSQIRYAIFARKMTGAFDFNNPTAFSPPGVNNFTVTGLDAQTAYSFVVRAQDPANNRESNTTEKSATTGVISFMGQVQPIFAVSCGGGSCHTGASPQNGLDLSSPAKSFMTLVSQASSACPGETRVVPSMPDKSYLVWKLVGQGMGACFQGGRMPPGGMLSAGDMNTVRGWISAGANNN